MEVVRPNPKLRAFLVGAIVGLILSLLPSGCYLAMRNFGSGDYRGAKLSEAHSLLQDASQRVKARHNDSPYPRRTTNTEGFWDEAGFSDSGWYVVVPVLSHTDGGYELYAISDFLRYPTLRLRRDGNGNVSIEEIGPYAGYDAR